MQNLSVMQWNRERWNSSWEIVFNDGHISWYRSKPLSFMPWLHRHLLGFLPQAGGKFILLMKWIVKQIFVDQKCRLCWSLWSHYACFFLLCFCDTRLVHVTSDGWQNHKSISDQWVEGENAVYYFQTLHFNFDPPEALMSTLSPSALKITPRV